MGQQLSFGDRAKSGSTALGISLASLICTLMIVQVIQVVHSETVCDKVVNDREKIQGIIINGENGFMFVDDRVFQFDVSNNFNAREHKLFINRAGVHVEKFFEGVYLKGSKIFGVYMVKSPEDTVQIHFIIVSDDESQETKVDGFAYDFSRKQSLITKSSKVPSTFPFIYFSNNQYIVYMYQIPIYSFGLKLEDIYDKDSVSYFSFNALEGEMVYQKSPDLSSLNRDQKVNAIFGMKLLLTSAFTYGEYIYLLTYDSVFIIKERDMQVSAMPNFTKKSLSEFLQCDKDAIMEGINWTKLITILLSVILVIIIFVLIFAIVSPSKPPRAIEKPKSISSNGSKSGISVGSSKSIKSSSGK